MSDTTETTSDTSDETLGEYIARHPILGAYRDDYTNPDAEDYWTDQDDTGSASALLLLAGLIPLVFVVWLLAHLAGALATVGGVQ